MTWTNELFYILVFNSITGGIAYFFWWLMKGYMEKRKKLKYVYPMIGVVLFFFYVPMLYMYLRAGTIVWNERDVYSGPLFIRTPFIYHFQCITAGIWILGVIVSFGKTIIDYIKFRHKMQISMRCNEVEERVMQISEELGISGKISVMQNYFVTSPIVMGFCNKSIFLPVKKYTSEELDTILYHELVHIKQKILIMKKAGLFLKLIYWCNPLINKLIRDLDEWGETACDLYVCCNTQYPFSRQSYFRVAVDELEQSNIWTPQMITGFNRNNGMKGRIARMKNYKKEKELKLLSGLLVGVLLCSACTTTAYAAGKTFSSIYEKVYYNTESSIEEQNIVEAEEHVEEFYAENYTIITDEESFATNSGLITFDKTLRYNDVYIVVLQIRSSNSTHFILT